MYSLFIDTHDKDVIIVLFKDGTIFVKKDIVTLNKHSEITMPTIDLVLKEANVDVNNLNSVIVCNGPGSFTGERIAVTIAKTMAYCLNIPIYVVDSLTIMAVSFGKGGIFAIKDKNGAFLGYFDDYFAPLKDFSYLNVNELNKLEGNIITDVLIDYEKVYSFVMKSDPINPHAVKPLYVKGISVLNDK